MLHDLLAAARRCDPWLIALIGTIQLLAIAAALAWLASHPDQASGTPTPSPHPQPAPTAHLET